MSEKCLCHELNLQAVSYESQESLAVRYKGIKLDCGYRLDIVEDKIILEKFTLSVLCACPVALEDGTGVCPPTLLNLADLFISR